MPSYAKTPSPDLVRTAEALIYQDCTMTHSVGALRNSLILVLLVVLAGVAVHRALYPTSRHDLPVALSVGATLVILLIPQSLNAAHNPLGRQLSFVDSAQRIARVVAFTAAYLGTAIAACPTSPFDIHPFLLALRATSATALWLILPINFLLFVPFYVALLAIRRVRQRGGGKSL